MIRDYQPIINKVVCDLCGMTFDKDDPLLAQRQARHAQKHTRGWNYKGRQNGGGNNTMGVPTWI